MHQPQPLESQQLFSVPVAQVPTSFWVTDLQLIVVHRSGLLKSLPIIIGCEVGKRTSTARDADLASRLTLAHYDALDGKCTSWKANIYREEATITVSPVRNGVGRIVGTIGRVETDDLQHGLPHLSVNIVPGRAAARTSTDLKALSDALFANGTHGVCTLDAEGNVTQWNLAMESLTGIPATLACGASVASIFSPLAKSEGHAASRLAKGEHLWLNDVSFYSRNGEDRYFDIALIPLLDQSQSARGTLGIFSDVTSRVLACRERDELAGLVKKLRATSKAPTGESLEQE